MAHLEERRWEGAALGLTRRDRRPCDYTVYWPDELAGRQFVLDGEVAADLADAEAMLVRLDMSASALADTEALARLLLRRSSRRGQSLDHPLRVGVPPGCGGRQPLRGAGACVARVLAEASWANAPGLGGVATHQRTPGCAGAHNLHRGGVDWKVVPGGKPGYQSTLGRGRAGASHSWAA
jgi:hypothetical protein